MRNTWTSIGLVHGFVMNNLRIDPWPGCNKTLRILPLMTTAFVLCACDQGKPDSAPRSSPANSQAATAYAQRVADAERQLAQVEANPDTSIEAVYAAKRLVRIYGISVSHPRTHSRWIDAQLDSAVQIAVQGRGMAPVDDVLSSLTQPLTPSQEARRTLVLRRRDEAARTQAAEEQDFRRRLMLQCGYNPSDGKYLGPIIAVGSEGFDSSGKAAPGQRSVTVRHPEGGPIAVTYPKFLNVRSCP